MRRSEHPAIDSENQSQSVIVQRTNKFQPGDPRYGPFRGLGTYKKRLTPFALEVTLAEDHGLT